MGVSHGGERGKTGSRMGGGTKERWKKKKRGRGGTHEQRSGEVEMEERMSGMSHGGERGKTGPEWVEERKKGEEEKGGGMNERRSGWECRTAGNAGIGTRMGGGAGKWRSKRAQAPFSAQTGLRPCGGGGGQGQEQGQGCGRHAPVRRFGCGAAFCGRG